MSAVRIAAERRPFFSPKSLAAYLELSERTVRELLAEGMIPSYRIGGARRVKAEDVDRFLETRREIRRSRG